jgi:carboxyl-terminal processing protease
MTSRHRSLLRRLALLSALAGSFGAGALVTRRADADPPRASPYRRLGVLSQVMAHIENSYVDPVNEDRLVDGAIRGMVSSLDPHSRTSTPRSTRCWRATRAGEFGGVGRGDRRPRRLPHGHRAHPEFARRAGGGAGGGRALSIEGRDARGLDVDEAVRRMRGAPGTRVRVVLRRRGVTDPLRLTSCARWCT